MVPSSRAHWEKMIPSLIYLDRYRNEGTRDYSPHAAYTEAANRYRPNSDLSMFRIPVFRIPLSELNIYSADPHPDLRALYIRGDSARFCVHPQTLKSAADDPYLQRLLRYGEEPEETRVSPSSSTRTLYVRDARPPHAVKVHFPFRVSRYARRMRDEVVRQALSVSRDLQEGIGSMGQGFAFLRETLGITHRNLNPESPRGEHWGFLVRELDPFPPSDDPGALVPGFSLFGRDLHEPGTQPLLFDFTLARDARRYVLEQIMLPIVRQWVVCFLNFGFSLEPHGQNVLLEIGADGNVSRIVYRDLNLGVDNRRRRDIEVPIDRENTYNQMESGEFNSITYDKFMGGHFFDHLLSTLKDRYPELDPEEFRGPCREEFTRIFPDHERYLPRTVRYFSEERDRFGKPLFRDTGQAPVWRP